MPETTSIYDESVFNILMEYEINRSKRYVSPVSLLRIGLMQARNAQDISRQTVSALSVMLNARLRRADIPAQFNDEFVVLLPVTDEANARAVCTRLLRVTHGTFTTPLGFSTPVSICIGLASHPGGDGLEAATLMREAQAALREARGHGTQSFAAYSDIAKSHHGGTSSPT